MKELKNKINQKIEMLGYDVRTIKEENAKANDEQQIEFVRGLINDLRFDLKLLDKLMADLQEEMMWGE